MVKKVDEDDGCGFEPDEGGTMAAGNTDVARFRVPVGVCQHHTRFNIGPWGLALHARDNYRVWSVVGSGNL
ncbi:hypothetical protein GQ457_12G003920 [Hibiscus cannabinus]